MYKMKVSLYSSSETHTNKMAHNSTPASPQEIVPVNILEHSPPSYSGMYLYMYIKESFSIYKKVFIVYYVVF